MDDMIDTNDIFNEELPEDQPISFYPSIERLRIILMFLMCINLLGFPTQFGKYIQIMFNFVPLAFFILSGFLILNDDGHRSERIVRTIKRTAIAFGIVTVVYFAINFVFYSGLGVNIFSSFISKRLWFNYVVLNQWPYEIGSAVWYLQALLYAYIIIYFLDRFNLLKYDWLICIILLLFTVVTGELCGIIRWSFLGYSYIPATFLTRSLPYILLGSVISRKLEFLCDVPRLVYWFGILFGFALMIGEILLFGALKTPGYYGHLIGMALSAVSVCMLAFQDDYLEIGFERVLNGSRRFTNIIYYICQPLSVGLVWIISSVSHDLFVIVSDMIGIITFVIAFVLLCIAALITRVIQARKYDRTDSE